MKIALNCLAATALLLSASARAQDPEKQKPIDKIGDTAENIAEKPLKDLNLVKDEIPPKLLLVMTTPYSLAGLKTCKQFSAEVAQLTNVLGPDVDTVKIKKGETPAESMLGVAESAAGSLVPFSGVIRRLSGADKAAERSRAAVLAGSLRRAYLKGTARAKGCRV